jgi:hypothetical protein
MPPGGGELFTFNPTISFKTMASIEKPTSPAAGINLSQAFDDIQAAGLQNINVDVDAAATIGTNSTAKSAATSNNVTGSSTSVADVAFNSGLQADEDDDTNIVNVASDAGLSGIATTTANSSAATSDGTATAFTNLGEAAGIQDLDSLQVGGELTALGKSLNTLGASAENVKGTARAYSQLSSEPSVGNPDLAEIQGFEGTQINVKSDATLQGLAQLSNSAAAATSAGDATAESFAAKLQGADLQGLNVGGIASVTGQATLSNLSTAETVVESSLGANALSSLGTAQGLVADGTLADLDGDFAVDTDFADAGVTVSSDASLTGLASITNNATASATKGDAGARSIATGVEGASLNTVQIGGVGTIGGQATYSAKATAGNVDGGNSGALADLTSAQGLEANAALDVKSDATIQGLANISNDALASGTAAGSSMAIAEASTLIGATLADNTDIGGIGSITGQVTFGSKATGKNVSGDAVASSSLGDQLNAGEFDSQTGLAQGLFTGDASGTDFGTDIKSDATIKGISSLNLQAEANTTNGLADADAYAGDIDGAKLGDVKIGGVGDLAGQASLTGKASSSNVLGGASNADSQLISADGLEAADLLKTASDGTIKGLSSINLSATAESTGGATETTTHAGFNGGTIQGASLQEVSIGGIGNLLGQVGFTGAGNASNVTGNAEALGELNTAKGLTTSALSDINSDGTLKGIASVTGSATAATTEGDAKAEAFADTINGADFGSLVDIGGIGSIQGAASFNLSAKSTNVTGDPFQNSEFDYFDVPADSSYATAGDIDLSAIGLQSIEGPGEEGDSNEFGIDIASDAALSGTAIGSLKAEAFSTATNATATLGEGSTLVGASLEDLHVGGIASVTGAAQLTGNGTASSVDGISTANSGVGATVTGLQALELDVASDASITAQAFGTLNATASSTGGNAFAFAGMNDEDLTQLTGLDAVGGMTVEIGGVATVSALAQGNESAKATSVDGQAQASAGMDALGAGVRGEYGDMPLELSFNSSSDANITGIAKLVASVDASNIGGADLNAEANGEFSAIGLSGLVFLKVFEKDPVDGSGPDDAPGIGGIGTLKGQAQITGTLNAESVSGAAEAGLDDPTSMIIGIQGISLLGASDGTILGSASGVFNTTADSTQGDANGYSAQNLRGMNAMTLTLGGNGGINAIVQDTNFVTAHSVSGNATAVASVDAIGLGGWGDEIGNSGTEHIQIAGNATIMGNVGVDSKAESHTTGG